MGYNNYEPGPPPPGPYFQQNSNYNAPGPGPYNSDPSGGYDQGGYGYEGALESLNFSKFEVRNTTSMVPYQAAYLKLGILRLFWTAGGGIDRVRE